MEKLSVQHIKALLWFHLLNQLRRIFATYVFSILAIGVGVLIAFVHYKFDHDVQYSVDYEILPDGYPYGGRCIGSDNPSISGILTNQMFHMAFDYSVTRGYKEFRMTTSIEQEPMYYQRTKKLDGFCSLMDRNKEIEFEVPFTQFQESRYVFTIIDTFSFSVFLFYAICLSELYQDRQRKTEELLWSLGISNLEQMISWYMAVIIQAMIWSAICFVQLIPIMFSLSSNLFILWLCLTMSFFIAAIFALISSKFVKGTLTFLLAVFQMVITWLALVIWSDIQLPYPSSKVVRLAILLHPITQARNMFLLTQSAEFSKVGINLFSLNSYFNVPQQEFFGNALETLVTMLVFSTVASLVFLINFEAVWASIIGFVLNKKANHEQVNIFEVHEESEIESKKKPVVEVSGLSKKYKNGTQAVTNVSFSIYEGEIVGLLGKNGAGKSTTMNIISGFHSATTGDVKICGIDSKSNRKEALSKLSFCPQEDRFFYRLTVMEHLKFMCMLKGSKFNSDRCVKLLKVLGLLEKRSQKPRNLSGGQKRRVCIAMAYAANSPLIILDEPTSAVDAATRKTLWSFFQAQQQENPNQAVILCTHFMQEADVLSQRIAIISDGYLRAIGTASYLKALFGVGYTFTYATSFDPIVREIVLKNCPDANFPTRDDQGVFQISTDKSSCLPKILDQLDEKGVEYSFNAATLENVFVSLSSSPVTNEQSFIDGKRGSNLLRVDDAVDKVSVQSMLVDNSEQHDRSENMSKNFFSWLFAQVIFAVLVDLCRVVMQNLKFLILFPIVLFGLPHIIMLLCYVDHFESDSENPFAHGNVTITPLTLNKNPKIAVFGDAPESEMKKLEDRLAESDVQIVDSISEDEIMKRYQEAPTEIFNSYLFFLKYNQISNMFSCLVNNHFQSSDVLCATLLVPIYSSSEAIKNLNVAVTYYPDNRYFWDYEENTERDLESFKLCQSAVFLFITPYIYTFLLYFVIRVESMRNEQNLTSFFRANGAFQLFSLFVRILGLFLLVFGYFATIVFYYEKRNMYLNDSDYLKFEALGPFVIFSVAFVCFAILIAKFFSSILIQLGLTLIVFVIYYFVFRSRELHDELTELSAWFYLLTVPGYVIPTGGLGLLFASDQKSKKEACIYWLIQFAVFFILIVVIESLLLRVFFNCISSVFRKRTTVQVHGDDSAVNVSDVRHAYYGITKSCKALQGMDMNVKEGECYALLGVNGAGKSTMFEILTGGIRLQSGLVDVFGRSVALNPWGVLRNVGYCSQVDKSVGYLKAETLVRLFGFLRGLTTGQITQQILFMAKVLDVEAHMDKLLSRCSGGTRRKVSTMIAFIGFPKLVILDESTTGLDPITRMNFGKLIRAAKNNGCTVIISSHTMEECESSADTICIMTKGKSFCEDTPRNLKEEHGKFYSVTVKVLESGTESGTVEQDPAPCGSVEVVDTRIDDVDREERVGFSADDVLDISKSDQSKLAAISDFDFCSIFPQATLQYTFSAGLYKHMFFNIPKDSVRLSALFSQLDQLRADNVLSECIVNTASLELIFMQIALEDEYGKSGGLSTTQV